jgi:DNA-binding NarL/FixJ family response regulator
MTSTNSSIKKILIAEDEEILRAAYKQILTQEGFKVFEAANGKEALKCLKKDKPDLILLDILMPEMDGLDFLKEASIVKEYPKTKVIAFSNLSDQHKLEAMIKLGVSKNILKSSLSPRQLADSVRQLLA